MSCVVTGMAMGAGIVMLCGVLWWCLWAYDLWRRS